MARAKNCFALILPRARGGEIGLKLLKVIESCSGRLSCGWTWRLTLLLWVVGGRIGEGGGRLLWVKSLLGMEFWKLQWIDDEEMTSSSGRKSG